MIDFRNTLGVGLYSPREAAFYARVRPETMSRWIFGDAKGKRVIDPQIEPADEKVVTFLDFVQAMAIRAIRLTWKMPLNKIRKAVKKAQSDFSVEYPLAMPHKTFIFSDRAKMGHGELVIKLNDDNYIQLSGREAGNYVMKEVVEPYLDHIEFDHQDLACRYTAWGSGNHSIVMDPHLNFGEPLLPSCGYTAQTLWEAVETEGSVQGAAAAYGVGRKDIMLACGFYDHLMNDQLREQPSKDSF